MANNRTDRRKIRLDEAEHRDAAHATRTAEEQILTLDRRLGKGQGARKERRKLLLDLGWSQPMVDLEFPLHKK
ncbi:MAG: hypothetical protein AAB930_03080 [Patescibacteria group bacterium]